MVHCTFIVYIGAFEELLHLKARNEYNKSEYVCTNKELCDDQFSLLTPALIRNLYIFLTQHLMLRMQNCTYVATKSFDLPFKMPELFGFLSVN